MIRQTMPVPTSRPANPQRLVSNRLACQCEAWEPPMLRFSPTAWAKLFYLRDLGDTEVGGFGISDPDDLLYVERCAARSPVMHRCLGSLRRRSRGGLL